MIGDKIKRLRLKCNLSIDEVAKTVGVSDSHIRKIESDSRKPSLDLIYAFAELFDEDVNYFIDDVGKKQQIASNLISKLIEAGIITDPENVDEDVANIIMKAVKEEIKNKYTNKKD